MLGSRWISAGVAYRFFWFWHVYGHTSSYSVTSTQIAPPGLLHLVVLSTSGGLVRVQLSLAYQKKRNREIKKTKKKKKKY